MFQFDRSLSDNGWIACAPSGSRGCFALVEQAGGGAKPAVRWVHEESWDNPALSLRHARRNGPMARHRCVALLARSQYQMLPMDAPEVPREEWKAAVRWKLKDMVDFAVHSAGIDVLEVPPEASARRQASLIAVASPETALRSLVGACSEAGVRLHALDVPETALRNLSALFAAPGRSHALLHIGPTHGTLVITTRGELLLSRQIDVTDAQIADPDESTRQLAFDRAGLELQRTLDGFERVFTLTSLERLHVLPGAGISMFCDYVRDIVYVPVAEAAPADVLDLGAVPHLIDKPETLPPYLVAIGAALRM